MAVQVNQLTGYEEVMGIFLAYHTTVSVHRGRVAMISGDFPTGFSMADGPEVALFYT